ncbi:MAG TPA: hypothetical protein VNH18_22070, partial [Bryobacteraceae bacterium]|nr:hypothetical protein [Bryobacteraceae bacterium]
ADPGVIARDTTVTKHQVIIGSTADLEWKRMRMNTGPPTIGVDHYKLDAALGRGHFFLRGCFGLIGATGGIAAAASRTSRALID